VGLKKLFGQITPLVCLSALCGYLAVSDVNHESDYYSRSSKNNMRSISNLVNSSHSVVINKKSVRDSIEESVHYATAHEDLFLDKEEARQSAVNDKYLLDNSEKIFIYSSRIYPLLTDKINSLLDTLESANRKEEWLPPEYTHMDEDWSLGSKLRIYLMLDALKDRSFCNTIGEMISKDVYDKYAEHGGTINFDENYNLRFKNIKSIADRTEKQNETYQFDEESLVKPFIALYHLHATKFDDSDFAGPSSWDTLLPFEIILARGGAHEFVITSLSKGKFNIDYYGGDHHSGLKVLDLGVYTYNYTK
jgi:hypothetical protein